MYVMWPSPSDQTGDKAVGLVVGQKAEDVLT